MNPQTIQTVTDLLINAGLKIIAALLIFAIGRVLIEFAVSLTRRALDKQRIEPTLVRYLASVISVLANIALIIAILGFFGVETTSFAALFAAAGIAIGAAWAGLLANFAAGAFIIVLRPYKVGDFITAGGVTGTVKELGLFVTAIDTPDNVLVFVGNNKIFSDNIQNFSVNPYRRVELAAQLNHSVDHNDAIARLKQGLANIPNVLNSPAPDVEILEFNLSGPVLAVRPYTNNIHYWQVYFDTNRLIRESFGQAGYPTPAQHFVIRNATG
ncbi:mechanosensitive ion channel family protein [Gloeobacter kilaueensis]|uniref:Mechanosensitive channel MscS n=1 Tax=Gloeobacter kilaueensis (strain ATCC BAA-2537 / CCAP 1431/1 / ULC 316 / JS1) TaxID=1183438 RepID=U5QJP9_GLOK1|nr:mechanosensitive ion channel family protein [Gloeobacter kilaueensis]AGY59118.1 mechanosensitive channel MscS [Gloeobacter kilaueensis JS1]